VKELKTKNSTVDEGALCPTVLLVDDDPSHLKLYSWIVSRHGYKAVTALVGSATVDLPTQSKPNVAVMDYRYSSQLTAPEVAKLIRETFPEIPLILLSEVVWLPEDMRHLIDAFVVKGEPDELLAIARLCGRPAMPPRHNQRTSGL
jgi:CheY-like chemotaxis protein